MKKGTKEYSKEELRNMAVVDAVLRGRLTIKEIEFAFSLTSRDLIRILKEGINDHR